MRYVGNIYQRISRLPENIVKGYPCEQHPRQLGDPYYLGCLCDFFIPKR